MNRRIHRLLVFCLMIFAGSTAPAQTFPIVPARSFLRANQETPPNAMPFALADLGFKQGDGMRLEQLGDFRPGGAFEDASTSLGAVFSSSYVLLAATELHRVLGAIDAGVDVITSKTYHGSVDTDIPEDFAVTDTIVQVPVGATHLFVAVRDSLYNDNSDPDGDFAVRISKADLPPSPVTALRIWAGLRGTAANEMAAFDLETGAPFSGIDIRDALRLARKGSGLDP